MELTVKANALVGAMAKIAPLANPKSPLYSSIRMERKGDGLLLTATDGETWMTTECAVCNMKGNDTAWCIDATALLNAMRSLGDAEMTVSLDTPRRTMVCSYTNGRFNLPYTDVAGFHDAKVSGFNQQHDVVARRLCNAMQSVIFATGNDELRPILGAVHMELTPDGMECVGTDGQRLVTWRDETICNRGGMTAVLNISKKPAGLLCNILSSFPEDDTVRLSFDERNVCVSGNGFHMVSRCTEGRYPAYRAVIPQMSPTFAVVQRDDIVGALKRVMCMASATMMLIVLTVDKGGMVLRAEDLDFSRSAEESVACEYNGDEALTIGFKASTLMDVLRNMPYDKVVMEFTDAQHASVLHGTFDGARDAHLALVMPVLVN